MIDRDEFDKLTREVETARRDRDRAEGRVEVLMSQLQSEHECGTVEDAKKRIKKLERKRDELLAEAEQDFNAFKKEWEDRDEAGRRTS